MQNSKIKYIVNTTTGLHDSTAALYEALMDEENDTAIKIVSEMQETLRIVKSNLS